MSAARRRMMCSRKEDTFPALGKAAAAGIGTCVNTHIAVSGGSGIRRGAVGGGAHSHIGRGGSGSRRGRGSVGGIQSHARGGGSGQGAVCSALGNMKGRRRGGGRRLGSGRVRRCGIVGRGRPSCIIDYNCI